MIILCVIVQHMMMLNVAYGKTEASHGIAAMNGAFTGIPAAGNMLVQNAGGDLAIQPA
jgi:hypothetical protein